jgi:predicted nucleotidyltransferase
MSGKGQCEKLGLVHKARFPFWGLGQMILFGWNPWFSVRGRGVVMALTTMQGTVIRNQKSNVKVNAMDLTARIREAVHKLEPDADIILYGSRSRGDADPDSDWDVLILVDAPVNEERTDRIRHSLYEIEWESGQVISSIVRTRDEWNSDRYKAMPFHQRVQREGIRL